MRRLSHLRHALASTPVLGVTLAIAITFVVAYRFPGAFIFLNSTTVVSRLVSPYEYAPIGLALILALSLTSRLRFIDEVGGRRIGIRASALAVVVLFLPVGIALAAMAGYPRDAQPPVTEVAPSLNNVLVMASAGLIFVLWLGRGMGGILTVGVYLLLIHAQNHNLAASVLPLNMALTDSGAVDRSLRWPWLVLLPLLALVSAQARRMVATDSFARFRQSPRRARTVRAKVFGGARRRQQFL